MFKARFAGWDDVLAVDYTLSADYVSKAAKQLGVTVKMNFKILTKYICRSFFIAPLSDVL